MNENNFEKLNREMNFEKSNLKKNLEENMEKTNSGKEFEELNSTEQIVELSEIKKTIQQYFNDNNYNYEVVDITFNRLSTGKIIYEVECKDFATDERKNLLYTIDEENKIKEYEPIDIDKIKYLQEIGQLNANINYTELEEKAKIEEKEITELRERETKSVNGNINKRNNAISLNELINNQEKQIEELKDAGNKLGFDSRVVEEYVKFNVSILSVEYITFASNLLNLRYKKYIVNIDDIIIRNILNVPPINVFKRVSPLSLNVKFTLNDRISVFFI